MKLRHASHQERPSSSPGIPVIGIDIGQKRDRTAICAAEIDYRKKDPHRRGSRRITHYLVRYLQRLPLGTPFPQVAERLGEICRQARERTSKRPDVFVDATGIGTPIIEVLEDHAPDACFVWAVYFTYGDRRSEDRSKRMVTLGKCYLVSRVQTLLQCRHLHLPQGGEARALARELLDYEIRVDENANDRYGAFRVGPHDDLVTALGLAVQAEPIRSVY